MKYILSDFYSRGEIFDKTTNDPDNLLYDFEDVKFISNSFISTSKYNNTVKRLYDNFIMLYKNCTISDFNIFQEKDFTLSATNSYPYYTIVQFNDDALINKNIINTNTVGAILIPSARDKEYRYTIISNNKQLAGYLIKGEKLQILFTTNLVDTISGSITFDNITDIKCYNGKDLYIVDSTYNSIIRYDIKYLIEGENIFRNRPSIRKVIGGKGNLTDRGKFSDLQKIAVNDNILVALDDGDKCFKIFDTNLNWINTLSYSKFFEANVPKFNDILLLEDNTLMSCSSSSIYKFNFSNSNFTLNSEVTLSNLLSSNETIAGLRLSNSRKELFYVTTNISVKKFWISQMNKVVSEYYLKNNNFNINWISTCKYDDTRDSVLLYKSKGSYENLSLFKDSTNLDTILNNLDFQVYDLNDLLISDQEYMQSWVMIKNFKKLYYNCFLLAKNVSYKFVENDNLEYDLIIDKVYNGSIINFSNEFSFPDNLELGVNEIFQTEVINRLLQEILDFQKILLYYVVSNKSKRTYLSPNPYRDSPSFKNYYYFADESLILNPNPTVLDIFEEIVPGAGISVSLGGAPYQGLDDISVVEGVYT
jgi:hypothetical protein